mgnify:CR=1 FL=1
MAIISGFFKYIVTPLGKLCYFPYLVEEWDSEKNSDVHPPMLLMVRIRNIGGYVEKDIVGRVLQV